jgi:PAS domain-containing protein
MRTRGLIEQAKGRLAERLGLNAEDAFRYLSLRSQQTNVPVVDVAADLMGEPRLAELEPAELAEARRVLRLQTVLDLAPDSEDLVDVLADDGALGAAALALFTVETDGALRLVTARGWPAGLVSGWRWIPPALPTPAVMAAQRGEPVWVEPGDSRGLHLVGPGPYRAAVPLRTDGLVRGVLEVAWTAAPGAQVRRTLPSVAERIGSWLGTAEVHSGFDVGWLEAVVDAMVAPAAVLTPVWSESEAIDDFRIDWVNQPAQATWGVAGSPVGRRLLDTRPGYLDDGTFDAYVRGYHGAIAADEDRGDLGTARVGDRLFVTWLAQDPNPGARVDARVSAMEELGPFGWGEWNRGLEPVSFSAGLYRLLGRSPDRGPIRLDQLVDAVAESDRELMQSTVDSVVTEGRPASVDIEIECADGQRRTVRVVATARVGPPGLTRAVQVLFQDRTEIQRGERAAASAAERLATQRVVAGLERAQTEQLRAAFFPPPWTRRQHGPLHVIGRHAAASAMHTFRGDFYEINENEGQLTVAVGDIFGSGVSAAHTMVRVRHDSRVLALLGRGPAEVLRMINLELCASEQPPLASLVLASVALDSPAVTWAQAGHYSPILVRDNRAKSVHRPGGDLLGLTETSRYGQGSVALREGDLLVFFTDGVFQRWAAGPAPVRRLAAACEQAQREGGAEALVAHLLPPADDEACLVALEWTRE